MDSTVKQEPDDLRLHLAQLPLLCELNRDELDHITASTRVMDLKHDDIVFRAGIKLAGCYCVLRSQLKLSALALPFTHKSNLRKTLTCKYLFLLKAGSACRYRPMFITY
jgi:hypothetical protein